VSGLAAKTSFPDYKSERFVVLNGLIDVNDLRAGQSVKIVQ
jgi:predicted Zn-dependent protease